MRLTTNLRNWGHGSENVRECAVAAEEAGVHTVWVNERLTTPEGRGWSPEDGGRWLDPLATLAFVAGATTRLHLGTGVVIVPYRHPIHLLKQVATLQDLSGGRLRLGVGAGWSKDEFAALDVPHEERGARTDRALQLLRANMSQDVVEGLPLLPRPTGVPIYVGGHSEAALKRAARFGDGWIAAGLGPEDLREPLQRLRGLADRPLEVVAMKTLPLEDPDAALAYAEGFRALGVDEVVHADAYGTVDDYRRRLDRLRALQARLA